MISAGELRREVHDGEEIAVHRRRAGAGQLEEIGVPLVGHDARPGRELGRKDQVAVLLRAVEDDVRREPGEIVAELGAPEERRRLELPAPILHRRHVVVERSESERLRHGLAIERQRNAVSRGAPERRAVHPGPQRRQRFDGIEQSLGVRPGPERDGRRHRAPLMGITGKQRSTMPRAEVDERLGQRERAHAGRAACS
jgi:hypothetical protein